MGIEMRTELRNVGFVVFGTALILLIPLVAMQFTSEVAWDLADFAAAAILLTGTGVAFVLSRRLVRSPRNRALVGVALAAALLLVWAELAVGIFT